MEHDSIDMEDDLKMMLSIWKMTLSMWNIVSLCLHGSNRHGAPGGGLLHEPNLAVAAQVEFESKV